MASKFKDPLLRELQSNNLFTIGGMASLIGSSYSTVWNLFDKLKEINIIETIGKAEDGKTNLWILSEDQFQDFTLTYKMTYDTQITRSRKKRNVSLGTYPDLEFEITLKGTVPLGTTEEQVMDMYGDQLKKSAMEKMDGEGMLKGANLSDFKDNRKISGVELKDSTKDERKTKDLYVDYRNQEGTTGKYVKRITDY